MFADFYTGKRVLVTGHTGFKGAWLSLWLRQIGAAVSGFSLDPAGGPPSLYEIVRAGLFQKDGDHRADLRDLAAVERVINRAEPEVIFHLAAQSLVRESYKDPLGTFQTNAVGTAHLLEAVRRQGRPCVVVIVTSDKCYENREWEHAYRENDALGGHDPYAMSKAASELVTASWRRSFFEQADVEIRVATARAGNVIGGGDLAPDRIIPDCVRALMMRQRVAVRQPRATRPWQHVLDCLGGYLWLGTRLGTATGAEAKVLATAFNFGPNPSANRPVGELVSDFMGQFPGGGWEDQSIQQTGEPHEASRLNLAIEKAGALLGWFPLSTFDESVHRTAIWYRTQMDKMGASQQNWFTALRDFSQQQISDYLVEAARQRAPWAK